ncbi:large ribosomal subunit protein uL1m [Gouania willdenowi]|uniref:Large ribosomal subunit protein uL1m n=1 Tax=Gouania willdenowi TaxID=441366 RepID=A0A8C5G5H6_GOUWI|nr:39S ribosomal protein L1, mitochondrial [Gouania willdenowi]
MASCAVTLVKGCHQQLLRAGGSVYLSVSQVTVRSLSAFQPVKKSKKQEAEPKVKKEKKVIDDTDRHKPYGKVAWAPVDDVYVSRHYPRTIYGPQEAINILKKFQILDFTPHDQPVYVNLKLDMALEKKKKVDSFVSVLHLPHPFNTDVNKVLVFTEDANQAKVALENGATLAGGVELIQPILDDEISADFYISVPDILPKLVLLKNKLRKKFPKSKRGSVGINLPRMLEVFKTGHEYMVENECYVQTQIATLNMPSEQIFANLQMFVVDVCSHKPVKMGPFIERAIITSQTSEALWFKSQEALPQPEPVK